MSEFEISDPETNWETIWGIWREILEPEGKFYFFAHKSTEFSCGEFGLLGFYFPRNKHFPALGGTSWVLTLVSQRYIL